MTPSAARAVFEAILWKPEIRWHVRRIEVMAPIRWISLRRNEVGGVVPVGSVKSAMKRGAGDLALYIEEQRQQRAGLFLRDVVYRLHADLEATTAPGASAHPVKYWEMFERRAAKGQCVNQPYLGCREFACSFRLVDGEDHVRPIAETRDLGWMLYDMDFAGTDDPRPLFFRATLEDGVLVVPEPGSPEVRG